jgi:biopolymer transport protein ExbB
VATGLGIAVAVPAVLAYNFYLRRLKVQMADFEQFGSAFLARVVRSGGASAPALRSEPIDNDNRGRELREARA